MDKAALEAELKAQGSLDNELATKVIGGDSEGGVAAVVGRLKAAKSYLFRGKSALEMTPTEYVAARAAFVWPQGSNRGFDLSERRMAGDDRAEPTPGSKTWPRPKARPM